MTINKQLMIKPTSGLNAITPLIGAHISTSGGLLTVFEKAINLKITVIQIFSSSPRQWVPKVIGSYDIHTFKRRCREFQIKSVFIHSSYLINLASEDSNLFERSLALFRHELKVGTQINASGVILHIGSTKGNRGIAIARINRVLKQIIEESKDANIIVENSAGQGGSLGVSLKELKDLIDKTPFSRVGICIDTAHAYAAGYEIRTADGMSRFINQLETEIGTKRLRCFHINDTKADLGSRRDRHENLGEGKLGTAGLKVLINHGNFRYLPFILETPGFNGKGPDRINVQLLSSLARKRK